MSIVTYFRVLGSHPPLVTWKKRSPLLSFRASSNAAIEKLLWHLLHFVQHLSSSILYEIPSKIVSKKRFIKNSDVENDFLTLCQVHFCQRMRWWREKNKEHHGGALLSACPQFSPYWGILGNSDFFSAPFLEEIIISVGEKWGILQTRKSWFSELFI